LVDTDRAGIPFSMAIARSASGTIVIPLPNPVSMRRCECIPVPESSSRMTYASIGHRGQVHPAQGHQRPCLTQLTSECQEANNSFSVFCGRHSWLFRRYEVGSASTSPTSTSVTIRPPTGPRRSPPV